MQLEFLANEFWICHCFIITGTFNWPLKHLFFQVLHPAGVPLYFTVHVSNEAGVSVPATCKLDTFDVTIPGGRMAEAFVSTSNPNVLKAVVTVYEDSPLTLTMVAVGYGKSIWGEQIIRWNTTTVAANTVDYDVGMCHPLNLKVIVMSFFHPTVFHTVC